MDLLPIAIRQHVLQFLKGETNQSVAIISTKPLSGGSINNAFEIETSVGNFFLKYNMASKFPQMFQKEAKGLECLRNTAAIDVPEILKTGETGGLAYLLLSYVKSSPASTDFWKIFGKQLAALHGNYASKFGLDHDNYMGSLTQSNRFHEKWDDFFVHERLVPQVKIARDSGEIGKTMVAAFERLYTKLNEICPPAKPSLVHGDLWSGNFMVNGQGKPCLIDPAVYYGHPEVDIAMSTLFGGFDQTFYEVYNEFNPLEKGWRNRLDIYNLYPLLVHVNLFGGGYVHQVQRIVAKF